MSTSLLDLVKNQQKKMEANKGRGRTVKPPPGKSKWRILPGWRGAGDDTFFHDFAMHYVKDFSGKTVAVYICSEKTFGRACPVCESISEGIRNSEDDRTTKLLKSAGATGRILVNAIQHGGETKDPVILELPSTVFQNYLAILGSYLEEHGINVLDLNAGYDITIDKQGSGLDTEYSLIAAPMPTKVDPSVMAKLNNLDTYVAQENETFKLKALTAVAKVTGEPAPALPAPAVAASRPAVSGPISGTVMPAATPATPAAEKLASAELTTDLGDLDLNDLEGVDLDGVDLAGL